MRLVGGDPTKVRWVILSHTHLDHAGGLMDLPRTPVLLTREELQFAFDPTGASVEYTIASKPFLVTEDEIWSGIQDSINACSGGGSGDDDASD